MKRKFITLLALLLLLSLTACGRKPTANPAPETDLLPGTGTETSLPENPDNQTGNPNPPTEDMQGTNGDMSLSPDPVDSVRSAEDAVRFISNNLYALCSDVLPMAVETRVLDLGDTDAIQYNTGLTNTDGITDIILSESAIGSFAYSLVYVRTDGTNPDAVHQALKDSIDPRKWVCVEAEAVSSIRLDDDICIVMGSTEQVDTIGSSLRKAAEGIFQTVGDPVTVL